MLLIDTLPIRQIESAISRLELRLVQLDREQKDKAIIKSRILSELDFLYSAREIRLSRNL